jgi:hypothetical protein
LTNGTLSDTLIENIDQLFYGLAECMCCGIRVKISCDEIELEERSIVCKWGKYNLLITETGGHHRN